VLLETGLGIPKLFPQKGLLALFSVASIARVLGPQPSLVRGRWKRCCRLPLRSSPRALSPGAGRAWDVPSPGDAGDPGDPGEAWLAAAEPANAPLYAKQRRLGVWFF